MTLGRSRRALRDVGREDNPGTTSSPACRAWQSRRPRFSAAVQLDAADESDCLPIVGVAPGQIGHHGQSASLIMVTITTRPTVHRQPLRCIPNGRLRYHDFQDRGRGRASQGSASTTVGSTPTTTHCSPPDQVRPCPRSKRHPFLLLPHIALLIVIFAVHLIFVILPPMVMAWVLLHKQPYHIKNDGMDC